MVFASTDWADPVQDVLFAVAVGILFIIAAALISGTLSIEFTPEEEGEEESLQPRRRWRGKEPSAETKRRVAEALRHAVIGMNPAELQEDTKPSREPRVEAPAEPPEKPLREPEPEPEPFLEPFPAELEAEGGTEGLKNFNSDTLELLVQEGKGLLAMARQLRVDRKPYARMLAKAREAMVEGRVDDSIQAMQFANERMRMRLEKKVSQ